MHAYTFKRWISYEKRHAVYLRDGYACLYCGRDLLDVAPFWRTLDHVTPRRAGGSDTPENLVTCCRSCNCSKQAGALDQWRPEAREAVLDALAQPLDLAYTRKYLAARRAARKVAAAERAE